MKQHRPQTAQNTNSGILDKSSPKRVQIPGDSEFEPPVVGTRGAVPNPTIDVNNFEATAKRLLDKENDADMELEPSSESVVIEPPTPEQVTIEKLYSMVKELQSRGGAAGELETVWAKAITDGTTYVEVEDLAWTQLIRKWAKNPPESVWYKDVRMFKKGTMEKILENESLSVDYVRGISTNKYSKNRFKGRE